MAAVPVPPDESELISKLLALATTLLQTPDGTVLRAQLERGSSVRTNILKSVDRAYIAFVHALLRQYSKNPKSDPATRVRTILIQQRIAPYLEPDKRAGTAADPGWQAAGAGALGAIESFEQQIASVLWSVRNLAQVDTQAEYALAPDNRRQIQRRISDGTDAVRSPDPHAEHNRLADIHTALGQGLDRALSETIDCIAHIKTAQLALHQADNTSEIIAFRQILFDCMDELIQGQACLAGHLRSADSRARELRLLHDQPGSEAGQPHDPTLTDALTGIPNRAALLHRLRAETGRAQRYGMPLALAILDPDRLNDIGSFAGAAAADEVVRCYAQDILANFRAYDMVARYNHDGEFAVLLPNTGREQAVSALHKARHRVSGTYYQHRGRRLSAPTFSSGLTWYLSGERPEDLLQRASQALRRAKSSGTNRIETALPETISC